MSFDVSYHIRAIDSFSAVAKKVERSVKSMSSQIQKTGQKMKSMGTSMKYLSVASTAVATASVFSFAKMEKGLISVKGLLTSEEWIQYGDSIKKAQIDSIKMGFSIEDTNQALYNTVSSIDISTNSLNAFSDAQTLAIAGNASLSSSILGMSKIMNAYGRDTTDTKQILNAFFTAQDIGTTTIEDLALNIGKVSGSAKMAGLSLEETLVITSALTNVLRNTEEAGTAFASIIKVVTKATPQQAKALNELGITTGVSAVKAVGFTNVLRQVRDAMSKHEDALAMAIPEMRAFKGVVSLTDDSLKLIDKTIKQVAIDYRDGTGAMKAFGEQSDTFTEKLKRSKGSLTIAMQKIGIVLAPTVLAISNVIYKLADAFSNANPAIKMLVGALLVLGIVIPPLLIMLGAVMIAVSFITLPMILVSLAITAVIAVIVLLVLNWKKLVKFFTQNPIGKIIKTGIELAINPINTMIKLIRKAISFVGKLHFVSAGVNKIKGIFGKREDKEGVTSDSFSKSTETQNNINQTISVVAPEGSKTKVSSEGDNLNLGTNMRGR